MSDEFVQNITDEYGIAIQMIGEPDEDYLELLQGYGDFCEMNEDDCSTDGVIWRANDFGSPDFCTKHTFPQEQLGYEFIEIEK